MKVHYLPLTEQQGGGIMLELNKIYCMDCLEGMKQLDDNSIDLTVTSPPYDNLRTKCKGLYRPKNKQYRK